MWTRDLSGRWAWLVVGTLGLLVVLAVPTLGSDPWAFRPGHVHPTGILAFVVRAGHERWDLGLLRTPPVLAGLLIVALAALLLAAGRLRVWLAAGAAAVVVLVLVLPGVLLQAGLRQSTAPWFFTNDSTYQIELAGSLVRHGHNPYGHDYSRSGLERFVNIFITVKGC